MGIQTCDCNLTLNFININRHISSLADSLPECFRGDRGADEETREEEFHWDGHVFPDVSIRKLDIQNFRGGLLQDRRGGSGPDVYRLNPV